MFNDRSERALSGHLHAKTKLTILCKFVSCSRYQSLLPADNLVAVFVKIRTDFWFSLQTTFGLANRIARELDFDYATIHAMHRIHHPVRYQKSIVIPLL